MRKLTACPRCEDEYLVVIRLKEATSILCAECGWRRDFVPRPDEDELHAKIDAAVREAREARVDDHQL